MAVTPDMKHAAIDEKRELAAARQDIDKLLHNSATEDLHAMREELKTTMTNKVGVYREGEVMKEAVATIKDLQTRFKNVRVDDRRDNFNTNLFEALELSNMLAYSELIVGGALAREESRGAHSRTDFPDRMDDDWMKHTMAFRDGDDGYELRYKPVAFTRYEPEERKY